MKTSRLIALLAVPAALAILPARAQPAPQLPVQTAAPAAAQAAAPATTPQIAVPVPNPPEALRNARYCEVIPFTLSLGTGGLKAQVFNSLGHGDCPQKLWEGLSETDLRRHFDALTVMLNGPRYFVMDRIIPKGATAKGELVMLNGITLEQRAELQFSLFELRSKPYSEHNVDRETEYLFRAGQPTFRLTAPDGSVYVMQSYAQILDHTLTYQDLPGLGAQLKLPEGWRYAMVVPEQDLVLKAEGKAVVLQDSLDNTYQKILP